MKHVAQVRAVLVVQPWSDAGNLLREVLDAPGALGQVAAPHGVRGKSGRDWWEPRQRRFAKVVMDAGRYCQRELVVDRRLNASACASVSPALRLNCRPAWSRQV